MDNKKHVTLFTFITTIVLLVVIAFLGANWYLHSQDMPNIFNLSGNQEEIPEGVEQTNGNTEETEGTTNYYTLEIGETYSAFIPNDHEGGTFIQYELHTNGGFLMNTGDIPGGVSSARGTFVIEGNELIITPVEYGITDTDGMVWSAMPSPETRTYAITGDNQFEITHGTMHFQFMEHSISDLATFFANQ
ncbi:MAG: hypothetical protein FWC68_02455 [Oscillospiraceae bacterium]|nr:hypothetical protein [Oscillospiraceae bacterium]